MEETETPDERPSFLKKLVLIIVGLFLLLLILSYFFLSDAIFGIISSQSVINNTLTHNNVSVRFLNGTLEKLQREYIDNEEREIKACLYGNITNNEYIATKIEVPEVIQASVAHIRSAPCTKTPIIEVHSHPVNRCLASEQDFEYFKSRKPANPELVMMVMCSTERFSVYSDYEPKQIKTRQ